MVFTVSEILLVVAITIFSLFWYIRTNFNYWKIKNVPHKKPFPLFGILPNLIFSKISAGHYFQQLYRECKGPYYGLFTMDKPCLLIKDTKIIKDIIVKDFQYFPNRFFYNDENADPILANVLFGIKAPRWQILRKKLSPVFTTGKIKMMLPLIMECANNMVNYLNLNTDISIESKDLSAKFSTDVIATCVFGINVDSFAEENGEFRVAGRKLFNERFTRTFQPLAYVFAHKLVRLLRLKFVEDESAKFLSDVFHKTIKQRELTKIKRNDLIDILIELKNQDPQDDQFEFDGNRLVAQAIIFFAAGHETTSSTIAFTLYELALNQKIQNQLREEINNTIKEHGKLTYEAVQSMRYLNMVLSETLRKYPLAAFLQRECEADYLVEQTGLVIERGVGIFIPLHGLQWDPNYFPNPESYDPERFNEKNLAKMDSFSYLPFGDGPRNCIGERFGLLEAKLGLIHIVKNFKVEPNSQTKIPLVFSRAILLQSVGGIPLTYTKIK